MADPNLQSVAFPKLDDAQIAELGVCTAAAPKIFRAGEELFRVGDREFAFFIVKSGEVEIVDYTGGEPKTIVVHSKGSFTGEVSQLTGGPSMVSAVAGTDCEVYEVSRENLRRFLNQCPSLSDVILQAFIARRQLLRESPEFIGLRVIGSRYSADTFRIRDFLAKNRVIFTWTDIETDPEVETLLSEFGITVEDTPVVACGHMVVLRNPTNRQLADKIGIHRTLDDSLYDLVVVGAGPAGLAAAVYGASEGLRTVVLEYNAPGGQAGSSMRIENYLGFPTGITGAELSDRAIIQANKFGAQLSVTVPVKHLEFDNNYPVLRMDGAEAVTTKCLLIATGAFYRKLEVEGCAEFEGRGVYYAATPSEAQICRDADVAIVGGGNSAGQAAVYLAQTSRRVLLLLRGDDLYKNMSAYLAHRIEQTRNIELLCTTTIRRIMGDNHLKCIEIVNSKTGEERIIDTPGVFSFIGASPKTGWLPEEIERDSKGFVRTGPELDQSPHWSLRRQPFLLETSRPGVFAAGDVRSGSVKRVASAVGEGSMAVQFVHQYLSQV